MGDRRRRTATAAAAACALALVATTGSALAAPAGGPTPVVGGGGSGGSSGGGTVGASVYHYPIVVTATGGGGKTIATYSVPSPPPICGYYSFESGPELAADWARAPEGFAHYHEAPVKPAGLDEHAKDGPDKGYWWADMCTDDGTVPDIDKIINAFFAANPDFLWIPAGGAPPIPAVPSAVLAASAFKTIPLPTLTISRNPSANAVTQLPTWFWYDRDVAQTVTVTASIPGTKYSATAVAVLSGIEVSVPALGIDKQCPDGGTPYSGGASSDCTVTFGRTNGPAGYVVNEGAHWTASYTGWDQPQRVDLPAQDTTTTDQVGVREIDSVVTTG